MYHPSFMRYPFLALSFILLGALVSPGVRANPLFSVEATKTWERCLISMGEKEATVSCAVGYQAKKHLDEYFHVHVPVVWKGKPEDDPAEFLRVVNPRLEIGGTVLKPQVSFDKIDQLPDGLVIGLCSFGVKGVPSKGFSIVATYQQPIYDDQVRYMPLFENGGKPDPNGEFSITFFPGTPATLALESKHEGPVTATATRITVSPRDREWIVVRNVSAEKK